ncbi:hypothetical protein AX15_000144 [Amanita polypyramis BW_CC]|nr:hypothetical protein AX15_000144 [Amanita polypyramis BW_CC]
MNTIIIHRNNRVICTPIHDLSAALISPVSKWYRKPMPWWVEDFEEVGLNPIEETDESAEEEYVFEDEDVGLVGNINMAADAMLLSECKFTRLVRTLTLTFNAVQALRPARASKAPNKASRMVVTLTFSQT